MVSESPGLRLHLAARIKKLWIFIHDLSCLSRLHVIPSSAVHVDCSIGVVDSAGIVLAIVYLDIVYLDIQTFEFSNTAKTQGTELS